ncbi:MAG: hypothetical protein JWQ38_2676 [Flavipsychrobacter sp.]|nr:hypothetical protein [Flavipsychrobacter sp.]
MARFQQVLKDVDDNLKVLPVLHSCDGYGFRAILESEFLKPDLCDFFNVEYLYAYYGIPSYRKSIKEATKNNAFYPVCFILDNSKLPPMDKLHPFDTGAFFKIPEIKADFFHPKMEIADFELEAKINEASKIVKKFYTDNINYVENRPFAKVDDFMQTEFEARSYAALISSEANTKYDNRVSTIEFIYKNSILLNTGALIQVIMPHAFLDDVFIKTKLNDTFNINVPLTYYTLKGDPKEHFGSIYNEYRKFSKAENLI